MKNNVANFNRIFVDRPLAKTAFVGCTPSLWMLCKDGTDYTEAALRVFLMLCLLASLVLGGLKVNRASAVQQESDFGTSVSTVSLHPSLPKVSLGLHIR